MGTNDQSFIEEPIIDNQVVEEGLPADDTTVIPEEAQLANEETSTESPPEDTEGQGEPKDTFYTRDQVEAAVKTRVGTFNRKIEKMKPYESAVKKISELTGMDVNTLISRLEGLSVADQARVLGVTPEQLQVQKANQQFQKAQSEQNLKLQRELEEQKLLVNSQYHDLPLFREEIAELMDENPKLSMKQAYTLVKGDSELEAVKRDAEQRAVAKMTKSSNQRVIAPGNPPTNRATKLDSATVQAAQKVGMDPAEYAAYSNIYTLDDFERMKSSKKG